MYNRYSKLGYMNEAPEKIRKFDWDTRQLILTAMRQVLPSWTKRYHGLAGPAVNDNPQFWNQGPDGRIEMDFSFTVRKNTGDVILKEKDMDKYIAWFNSLLRSPKGQKILNKETSKAEIKFEEVGYCFGDLMFRFVLVSRPYTSDGIAVDIARSVYDFMVRLQIAHKEYLDKYVR